MSRLLISCDNTLYEVDGKIYFKNKEWYDFYQRYLRVFDCLTIANRVLEEKTLSCNRVIVDDERINIIKIPFFSGPFNYAKVWFKINKQIGEITNSVDCGLFRLPSTIGQRICDIFYKAGIPYALEIVYDANDGWHSSTSFLEKILWKMIDKRMIKSCSNAKGVSYVTEQYLQRHYPPSRDAFTANYSSLSLNKSFYTGPRNYPKHRSYVIAHVANQVMYNGRKGYNQLIEAVKILNNRGVNVKVVFGGPSYNNGIELLSEYATSLGVKEKVEFAGYLTREQLSEYLELADIFVLPTMAEGLPRVLIEAMAKGLPCVTTKVSGNSELIEEKYLFKYGDVNNLVERIYSLLCNRELYEDASKKNFDKSTEYEASVLEKRRDNFYYKLKQIAYV